MRAPTIVAMLRCQRNELQNTVHPKSRPSLYVITDPRLYLQYLQIARRCSPHARAIPLQIGTGVYTMCVIKRPKALGELATVHEAETV